jgi:predicted XRE-type DNA-binding protein
MVKTSTRITRAKRNVFEDLGFDDAEGLQAEAILAHQIGVILEERKLTQRAAAELLGVDQADVSKITQGRSTGFSLRRLVRLLNRLDRDVELVVKPSRAKGRATFVVRAA